MAEKKQEDYRSLRQELDEILSNLQSGDLDIEEAAGQYERAIKIVNQLEAYITKAENKIVKVKKNLS